jgi:hypothetical protein
MPQEFMTRLPILPVHLIVSCAVWHGPFSPYEALCLTSFLAAGVAVELFSEAPISGLPAGVIRRDARSDCDVAHYRHESMVRARRCIPPLSPCAARKLGGWWVDTDEFARARCLSPRLPLRSKRRGAERIGDAFSPATPDEGGGERTAA